MKFLEVYRGWQIYLSTEGYFPTIKGQPTGQTMDRYIAIEPISHNCIDDVSLGSLKSQINEAQK